MAFSSCRSHRALSENNQNVQNQICSTKNVLTTAKSVPAILSRKRKATSDVTDVMDPTGFCHGNRWHKSQTLDQVDSPKTARLSTSSSNVLRVKQNGVLTSGSGRAAENLPPRDCYTFCHSAVGSTSTSIADGSSSRVPLATLQHNSISNKGSNKMTMQPLSDAEDKQAQFSPSNGTKKLATVRISRGGDDIRRPIVKHFKPQAAKKLKLRESWSRFREFVNKTSAEMSRSQTPFPSLRWADKQELWDVMCKKESGMYTRKTGPEILLMHPAVEARMRSILIDWMIEVCGVYKLHRETFYLSVDFLDRYLCSTADMARQRLQLVGVTCLFIASKIEEIYPPKLREFAFVTDGACSEDEIISMELVVLKGLNWGLSPYTPNRWIKIFMQVNSLEQDKSKMNVGDDFVVPQYVETDYLRAMQLLDLVILDIGSLAFKYSVLAASTIYHCHDEKSALEASGYRWKDIAACVDWMSPFVFTLRESGDLPAVKSFEDVIPEDYHNIQTHMVELSMLEEAQQRQQLMADEVERSRHSPDLMRQMTYNPSLEMTPPEDYNEIYHQFEQLQSIGGDESGRDARVVTASKLSSRQQSSVFLSPTSENEMSGFW